MTARPLRYGCNNWHALSSSGLLLYSLRCTLLNLQKHQKLRDANAKLESELAEEAASTADKAQRLQLQVDEQQKQNDVLEHKLGEHRLEITKFQMLVNCLLYTSDAADEL